MERQTPGLVLVLVVVGISGCGGSHQAGPRTSPVAAAPKRQLLFAFPKLGRLYADCRSADALRFVYTANRDADEDVAVFASSKRVARRNVVPSGSLRFKVKVIHRPYRGDTLDESPPMRFISEVNREPYGTRVVARFKLLQARDGSGECLAASAGIRVRSDSHLG